MECVIDNKMMKQPPSTCLRSGVVNLQRNREFEVAIAESKECDVEITLDGVPKIVSNGFFELNYSLYIASQDESSVTYYKENEGSNPESKENDEMMDVVEGKSDKGETVKELEDQDVVLLKNNEQDRTSTEEYMVDKDNTIIKEQEIDKQQNTKKKTIEPSPKKDVKVSEDSNKSKEKVDQEMGSSNDEETNIKPQEKDNKNTKDKEKKRAMVSDLVEYLGQESDRFDIYPNVEEMIEIYSQEDSSEVYKKVDDIYKMEKVSEYDLYPKYRDENSYSKLEFTNLSFRGELKRDIPKLEEVISLYSKSSSFNTINENSIGEDLSSCSSVVSNSKEDTICTKEVDDLEKYFLEAKKSYEQLLLGTTSVLYTPKDQKKETRTCDLTLSNSLEGEGSLLTMSNMDIDNSNESNSSKENKNNIEEKERENKEFELNYHKYMSFIYGDINKLQEYNNHLTPINKKSDPCVSNLNNSKVRDNKNKDKDNTKETPKEGVETPGKGVSQDNRNTKDKEKNKQQNTKKKEQRKPKEKKEEDTPRSTSSGNSNESDEEHEDGNYPKKKDDKDGPDGNNGDKKESANRKKKNNNRNTKDKEKNNRDTKEQKIKKSDEEDTVENEKEKKDKDNNKDQMLDYITEDDEVTLPEETGVLDLDKLVLDEFVQNYRDNKEKESVENSNDSKEKVNQEMGSSNDEETVENEKEKKDNDTNIEKEKRKENNLFTKRVENKMDTDTVIPTILGTDTARVLRSKYKSRSRGIKDSNKERESQDPLRDVDQETIRLEEDEFVDFLKNNIHLYDNKEFANDFKTKYFLENYCMNYNPVTIINHIRTIDISNKNNNLFKSKENNNKDQKKEVKKDTVIKDIRKKLKETANINDKDMYVLSNADIYNILFDYLNSVKQGSVNEQNDVKNRFFGDPICNNTNNTKDYKECEKGLENKEVLNTVKVKKDGFKEIMNSRRNLRSSRNSSSTTDNNLNNSKGSNKNKKTLKDIKSNNNKNKKSLLVKDKENNNNKDQKKGSENQEKDNKGFTENNNENHLLTKTTELEKQQYKESVNEMKIQPEKRVDQDNTIIKEQENKEVLNKFKTPVNLDMSNNFKDLVISNEDLLLLKEGSDCKENKNNNKEGKKDNQKYYKDNENKESVDLRDLVVFSNHMYNLAQSRGSSGSDKLGSSGNKNGLLSSISESSNKGSSASLSSSLMSIKDLINDYDIDNNLNISKVSNKNSKYTREDIINLMNSSNKENNLMRGGKFNNKDGNYMSISRDELGNSNRDNLYGNKDNYNNLYDSRGSKGEIILTEQLLREKELMEREALMQEYFKDMDDTTNTTSSVDSNCYAGSMLPSVSPSVSKEEKLLRSQLLEKEDDYKDILLGNFNAFYSQPSPINKEDLGSELRPEDLNPISESDNTHSQPDPMIEAILDPERQNMLLRKEREENRKKEQKKVNNNLFERKYKNTESVVRKTYNDNNVIRSPFLLAGRMNNRDNKMNRVHKNDDKTKGNKEYEKKDNLYGNKENKVKRRKIEDDEFMNISTPKNKKMDADSSCLELIKSNSDKLVKTINYTLNKRTKSRTSNMVRDKDNKRNILSNPNSQTSPMNQNKDDMSLLNGYKRKTVCDNWISEMWNDNINVITCKKMKLGSGSFSTVSLAILRIIRPYSPSTLNNALVNGNNKNKENEQYKETRVEINNVDNENQERNNMGSNKDTYKKQEEINIEKDNKNNMELDKEENKEIDKVNEESSVSSRSEVDATLSQSRSEKSDDDENKKVLYECAIKNISDDYGEISRYQYIREKEMMLHYNQNVLKPISYRILYSPNNNKIYQLLLPRAKGDLLTMLSRLIIYRTNEVYNLLSKLSNCQKKFAKNPNNEFVVDDTYCKETPSRCKDNKEREKERDQDNNNNNDENHLLSKTTELEKQQYKEDEPDGSNGDKKERNRLYGLFEVEIKYLLIQILSGLSFIHMCFQGNILRHTDIKLTNILVFCEEEDRYVPLKWHLNLADFGCSMLIKPNQYFKQIHHLYSKLNNLGKGGNTYSNANYTYLFKDKNGYKDENSWEKYVKEWYDQLNRHLLSYNIGTLRYNSPESLLYDQYLNKRVNNNNQLLNVLYKDILEAAKELERFKQNNNKNNNNMLYNHTNNTNNNNDNKQEKDNNKEEKKDNQKDMTFDGIKYTRVDSKSDMWSLGIIVSELLKYSMNDGEYVVDEVIANHLDLFPKYLNELGFRNSVKRGGKEGRYNDKTIGNEGLDKQQKTVLLKEDKEKKENKDKKFVDRSKEIKSKLYSNLGNGIFYNKIRNHLVGRRKNRVNYLNKYGNDMNEEFNDSSFKKKEEVDKENKLLSLCINDICNNKFEIRKKKLMDLYKNNEVDGVDEQLVNLMVNLLSYEPDERLLSVEALGHPCFNESEYIFSLVDKNNKEFLKKVFRLYNLNNNNGLSNSYDSNNSDNPYSNKDNYSNMINNNTLYNNTNNNKDNNGYKSNESSSQEDMDTEDIVDGDLDSYSWYKGPLYYYLYKYDELKNKNSNNTGDITNNSSNDEETNIVIDNGNKNNIENNNENHLLTKTTELEKQQYKEENILFSSTEDVVSLKEYFNKKVIGIPITQSNELANSTSIVSTSTLESARNLLSISNLSEHISEKLVNQDTDDNNLNNSKGTNKNDSSTVDSRNNNLLNNSDNSMNGNDNMSNNSDSKNGLVDLSTSNPSCVYRLDSVNNFHSLLDDSNENNSLNTPSKVRRDLNLVIMHNSFSPLDPSASVLISESYGESTITNSTKFDISSRDNYKLGLSTSYSSDFFSEKRFGSHPNKNELNISGFDGNDPVVLKENSQVESNEVFNVDMNLDNENNKEKDNNKDATNNNNKDNNDGMEIDVNKNVNKQNEITIQEKQQKTVLLKEEETNIVIDNDNKNKGYENNKEKQNMELDKEENTPKSLITVIKKIKKSKLDIYKLEYKILMKRQDELYNGNSVIFKLLEDIRSKYSLDYQQLTSTYTSHLLARELLKYKQSPLE